MFRQIQFAKGNQEAVIRMIVLAIFAFTCPRSRAQNSTVSGTIKNASGEPVAGALVKVRSADSRLAYMVVSQAQGRYSTPNLPPGKYTVQGFGGGYQSDPAEPVEVASGQPGKMDLGLTTPQKTYPPPKKFTDADYEALMPEGDGKRLLLTRCVICHGPGNYVARRKTREDWAKTVDKMRYYLQTNLTENSSVLKEYTARTGKHPRSEERRVGKECRL